MDDQDQQPNENAQNPSLNPPGPADSPMQSEPDIQSVAQAPVSGDVQPPVSPAAPSSAQPAIPPAAPMASGVQPPAKKGRGKKIVLILVVIFVFLLIAGGVGAFSYLNHLNNKPEKVLADALANTAAELLERTPATTVTKVVFASKTDDTKVTVDLDTKNIGENGEVSAKVDFASQGKNLTVQASAMMIGQKEYYFRIDNLRQTIIMALQTYGSDYGMSNADANQLMRTLDPIIKKIDGVWVQITTDDLQSTGAVGGQELDKCTEAVQKLRISSSDQTELKKLFGEHQFILAKEVYDNQAVDGDVSFHYLIDFNDDAAIAFFRGAVKLESFKQTVEACDIDTEDIEKPEQTADSEESDNEMTVELWVDTKTRRFSKIQVKVNDAEVSVDFATSLKLDVSDLKIEKPSDFVTIEQLQKDLEALFQGMSFSDGPSPNDTLPSRAS